MTAVLHLLSEKPISPGWAFAMSLAIGIGVTIVVAIIQVNREKWKEQFQRECELKTLSKHSQTPEEIRAHQELPLPASLCHAQPLIHVDFRVGLAHGAGVSVRWNR